MPRINDVIEIDKDELQNFFSGLAYGEHMGDVANDLIYYAEKWFGIERRAVREDDYDRLVFPWDDEYSNAREGY